MIFNFFLIEEFKNRKLKITLNVETEWSIYFSPILLILYGIDRKTIARSYPIVETITKKRNSVIDQKKTALARA